MSKIAETNAMIIAGPVTTNKKFEKRVNQEPKLDTNPIKDTTNFKTLKNEFSNIKNQQGVIGKLWDNFKNVTGLGYSSKDVEKDIKRYYKGEISEEEARTAIAKFSQKQNGMIDMAANIISGFAVAGSAIFTGGTSLKGGAIIGAAVKSSIKTLDRATNKIKGDAVNLKQIIKDSVTGAVDGAVTIATGGMVKGPIVGQSIKQTVKNSVKQGFKAGAISGAAAGAANYTVEAATEKDVKFSIKELASTTIQNGIVGGTIGGVASGLTNGLAQKKFNSPQVKELAENFKIKTGDVEGSEKLLSFLSRNKKLEVDDLNNYIKNLDLENLHRISPKTKGYETEQLINFYEYHYKAGTKVFDVDSLTVDDDFTKFLRENYVNKAQMDKLMDIFPETSRYVGKMPEGWLSNIAKDKQGIIKQEIYDAIKKFQTSDQIFEMNAFAKRLTSILGKKASVCHLGSGTFGTGYKISVEGADDVVLKIFDNTGMDMFDDVLGESITGSSIKSKFMRQGIDILKKEVDKIKKKYLKVHGQHIETQTGLFVNEHSNDFVKMHFGKVTGAKDSDGFLVTQFLGDGVTPKINHKIKSGYKIKSRDAWTANSPRAKLLGLFDNTDHNIINGKIIDYGAVEVKQTGFNGFLESIKNFFVAA